jgi:hypothetical protein
MKYNNLFPQDTRMAELASAWAMMIVGISSGLGLIVNTDMVAIQSMPFWSVCITILGCLQFVSLWCYPRIEVLRISCSWASASFWMWLFLSSLSSTTPEDIASLALSITNYYAFIININLRQHKWVI